MNFIDVLNTATATISDYALAKKLGIKPNTVSNWRNRGSIPNDNLLDQIAVIANIPVEKVYYAAYAEKVGNPVVSEFLRSHAGTPAH